MIDFEHVRRGEKVADTAYCVVHEAWHEPAADPGRVQKCAMKVAKREDEATRLLMKGEFDRLSRLFDIGRGDEPSLVPEPLALQLVKGQTTLLMEWVDGTPLDEQTSRGKANPKPALYVVESLRRMMTLLDYVHRPDGLDAVLPDLKTDAVILAGRAVRVLDWNVVHKYHDDGAVRDLQAVVLYMAELAVGTRLGSFAAAAESITGMGADLESSLVRTLLSFVHSLARNTADLKRLRVLYASVIELCEGYEEALNQLHWASLELNNAQLLRGEVQSALDSARQRSALGNPPALDIQKRELKPRLRPGGTANREPDSLRRSVNRLIALFAESGVIDRKHVIVAPVEATAAWPDLGDATSVTRPTPTGRAAIPGPPPRGAFPEGRLGANKPGVPTEAEWSLYRELERHWPRDFEALTARADEVIGLYDRFGKSPDLMQNLHAMNRVVRNEIMKRGSEPHGRGRNK